MDDKDTGFLARVPVTAAALYAGVPSAQEA